MGLGALATGGAHLVTAGRSLFGGRSTPGIDAAAEWNALARQQQGEQFTSQLRFSMRNARRNRRLQKLFAQKSLRWKVRDAKAAGLHPLYALGGSGATYSPAAVSLPGTSSGSQASASDTGFDRWSAAGQNLSRAIEVGMSAFDRQAQRLAELEVERGELENQLLRARIAGLSQVPPAIPSASPGLNTGGGDARIEEMPMRRTAPEPSRLHQEPGAVVDLGFARTPTGYAPTPSTDVKEKIEDQFIPEIMWALRNLLLPNVGRGTPPPDSWKGRGTKWHWSRRRQEWQSVYPGRRKPVYVERVPRRRTSPSYHPLRRR